MFRLRMSALFACALVVGAGPAHGATTGYSTLATYLAGGGNATIQLNFDPGVVGLVAGTSFSTDVTFRSPEGSDPTLVFNPSGPPGDGCVGGSHAATGTFNGILEILLNPAQETVAANIRSAGTNVTIDAYDVNNVQLLAGFSSPPSFWGIVSDVPIARIVITPGTFIGGGRDATCYDNLSYGRMGTVPTVAESWGRLKAHYRAD